jgi:hypothetical protein
MAVTQNRRVKYWLKLIYQKNKFRPKFPLFVQIDFFDLSNLGKLQAFFSQNYIKSEHLLQQLKWCVIWLIEKVNKILEAFIGIDDLELGKQKKSTPQNTAD